MYLALTVEFLWLVIARGRYCIRVIKDLAGALPPEKILGPTTTFMGRRCIMLLNPRHGPSQT